MQQLLVKFWIVALCTVVLCMWLTGCCGLLICGVVGCSWFVLYSAHYAGTRCQHVCPKDYMFVTYISWGFWLLWSIPCITS